MKTRACRIIAAILALGLLSSCLADTSRPAPPQPSISVSNVSGAQCAHGLNNVVTCSVTMDIQLNNVAIGDTVITFTTTDTLAQVVKVLAIGSGINAGFSSVKLVRNDTGCLRPQASIFAYDGASTTAPLIIAAPITPITLSCN